MSYYILVAITLSFVFFIVIELTKGNYPKNPRTTIALGIFFVFYVILIKEVGYVAIDQVIENVISAE